MALPRFQIGDSVNVLNLGKSGHVRIPKYIRNKSGKIVQYCGCYLNPEDLAVGNTAGPAIDLYRVEFDQMSLWPDNKNEPGDTLVIEIYEHWLVPEKLPTSSTADKP
ncbi:MAG: SH3-like domain-containing protein [Granulosicoccus sp.]